MWPLPAAVFVGLGATTRIYRLTRFSSPVSRTQLSRSSAYDRAYARRGTLGKPGIARKDPCPMAPRAQCVPVEPEGGSADLGDPSLGRPFLADVRDGKPGQRQSAAVRQHTSEGFDLDDEAGGAARLRGTVAQEPSLCLTRSIGRAVGVSVWGGGGRRGAGFAGGLRLGCLGRVPGLRGGRGWGGLARRLGIGLWLGRRGGWICRGRGCGAL